MAKLERGPFTDKEISNLKPRKTEYWVREGKGFCVRVYPSGEKAWYYIYTFDGRKRYMRLGEGAYPEVSLSGARKLFNSAKVKVDNGTDPLAEQDNERIARKRTPFVADFIDEYITRFAKEHNRGWKEIERALKSEIAPKWGKRKITDIKRRDLVVILDDITDRGAPIMANRVLAYTRKMFSYAVKRDALEANPFMGMDRPSKEEGRERALSVDEIKTLWANLDKAKMSDCIKRALKLILVTAQRPGEVIGIHSREIAVEQKEQKNDRGKVTRTWNETWWTIPAERSKNKQVHRVFLTPLALELLGDKEGYIFESPANPGVDAAGNPLPPKPYEVRTMTHDIKANLPHTPESKVEDRLKIAHFTPHDLRRSAATCMAEMGIPGDILDRVQNHISKQKQGVGHIYNRYSYDKEKRAALEAWGRKLTSLITSRDNSNVITMQRKGARG